MHNPKIFCIFARKFQNTSMNTKIVMLPTAEGLVEDIENLAWDCHDAGLRLEVHAERLALALLRDPKEWGADEVVVEDRYNLGDIPEEKLVAMAERVHSRATYLSEMVQAYGYEQENAQFFDTIRIRFSLEDGTDGAYSLENASLQGIEMKQDGEFLLIRVLPTVTLDDMNSVIEMLADGVGAMAQVEDDDEAFDGMWALDEDICK